MNLTLKCLNLHITYVYFNLALHVGTGLFTTLTCSHYYMNEEGMREGGYFLF